MGQGSTQVRNGISHLELYCAFLCGLADELHDRTREDGLVDRCQQASLTCRAAFEAAAPRQEELTTARALASYLEERTFLLSRASLDRTAAVLADPVIAENLRAVRTALAATPGGLWLRADADLSGQLLVAWEDAGGPPELDTAEPLRDVMAEFARETAADSRAGGPWWSAPTAAGLPATTRRLRSFSAVELICRDDSFGETRASAWPVTVAEGARVAEVHGPADWAALVDSCPLDVTRYRQNEWSGPYRSAGPWLVPDWARLARDWDGVHVSAEGYLRTKGQRIQVRDGVTVLDGWDPDATFWLRDVLILASGSPEVWIRDDADQDTWRRHATIAHDS